MCGRTGAGSSPEKQRSPTRLPHQASSFVGRQAELESIRLYFEEGGRVVTILGPAGVGKTRLARRHAAGSEHPAGSVWICDLAEAASIEDVLRAVASSLDVPLTLGKTTEDARAQVGYTIAERGAALVVLDGAERVAVATAALLDVWLVLAKEAAFLVTSREPLDLPEEIRVELAPLDEEDALTLFEDRARAVHSGLVLAPESRSEIREIVRHLDCIPLAVELAASRAVLLSPAQILARLPRRFELLRRRGGPSGHRHATLEGAIDWSWNLLSADEQAALAQCSVFRGGFTLDATEHVVDTGSATSLSALDLLHALRERSMLRTYAPPGFTGEIRLGLYESIRDYAAAKLGAQATGAEVELRHARYYVEQGERWAARIASRGWREALGRLSLEFENLAAVARRPDLEPELTVRAALALDPLLAWRGPLETRLGLLQHASAALDRVGDPMLASRLRLARGGALRESGALTAALAELERARANAPDPEGALLAEILDALGWAQADAGSWASARASFAEAIVIARRAGDVRTLSIALTRHALLTPDGDEAEAMWREAEALLPEVQDPTAEAWVLINLGNQRRNSGRVEEAKPLYARAIAAGEATGDLRVTAPALQMIGSVHIACGEIEEAKAALARSLDLCEQAGSRRLSAICLNYIGVALLNEDRPAEAKARLEQALDVARRARAGLAAEALPLVHLGAVEALCDRVEPASALFAAYRAAIEPLGHPELTAILDMEEGVLDVARARRALAAGDPAAAQRHRDAALRRLNAAASMIEAQPGTTSRGRFGVLITRRILENALAEDRGARAATPQDLPEPPRSAHDLEVGRACAWFRLGGQHAVDLRRRQPLRRVLTKLVAARLSEPGAPVAHQRLIEVAWPQERLQLKSAMNRLHNAIATLRGLGLRSLLVRREGGYLIVPDASVVTTEAEQPPGAKGAEET